MVAADLARPAAVEQLHILGDQIGVDVFSLENTDPVDVVKEALKEGKNYDFLLIYTAGRLQIDEALMGEVKAIQKIAKPDEVLLSVDAMSGQDIINVAEGFYKMLDLTGLMATKFDGDARGGAILSVRSLTNVPVKFVGVGEKIEDLEVFHPDRVASRILGMGDVVSPCSKIKEKMDMEEAEKAAERMMKGQFTLDDMLTQIQQVSKMGPLSGIMKMVPGMNQFAGQMDELGADDQMKKVEAMILSMTPYERANPDKIRSSQKRRIAEGSGTSTTDVNRLLRQYNQMKKQMRMLSRFLG